MKRILILILAFLFVGENAFCGRNSNSTKRSGSSRRATSAAVRSSVSSSSQRSSSSKSSNTDETDKFMSCMDNFCKSSSDDEKGRCRCSANLSRIEKIFR